MLQRLTHGLLLLKVTRLAELMPRSQAVCSSRTAVPSGLPYVQDLALMPGVGHWGGNPGFVAHFQETVPACFLQSGPVDGGITTGLCDQPWDTGEDSYGSLGSGAGKSPIYPLPGTPIS